MAIILDDAVKEIISKASLEQTSSLLRGATAVTPYEAAAENPDSIISSASKASLIFFSLFFISFSFAILDIELIG